MTETMETTVFHSLHSSHLEILTVNMDILLVVMLQIKSHMICILKLLPNNVLTPHKQENRPVQPAYILFVAAYMQLFTLALDCKTFINYISESVAIFLSTYIHIYGNVLLHSILITISQAQS